MKDDLSQAILEGLRDRLAQDVVGAIDIGIDQPPITGPKQAALNSLALIGLVFADGFKVEKGTFGGIGLFLLDDPDTGQFGLVGQHVDELGQRNRDEILVVLFAQLDLLFPVLVFTDDQGANAFSHQQVDDPFAGHVQVVLDLPVALVGQVNDPLGQITTGGQQTLKISPGFMIVG